MDLIWDSEIERYVPQSVAEPVRARFREYADERIEPFGREEASAAEVPETFSVYSADENVAAQMASDFPNAVVSNADGVVTFDMAAMMANAIDIPYTFDTLEQLMLSAQHAAIVGYPDMTEEWKEEATKREYARLYEILKDLENGVPRYYKVTRARMDLSEEEFIELSIAREQRDIEYYMEQLKQLGVEPLKLSSLHLMIDN